MKQPAEPPSEVELPLGEGSPSSRIQSTSKLTPEPPPKAMRRPDTRPDHGVWSAGLPPRFTLCRLARRAEFGNRAAA